jgi:hypothetical protein
MGIAGGALNIGGPSTFPSGRGDTTIVAADTMSCLCGRHSLKVGGEYRQFLNNNFRRGTGAFSFPSIAAFLADTANSFSITLGNQNSSIAQGAFGFFVQDNYKLRPNLTLELGLRYDWNLTPDERYGRFIVFDPDQAPWCVSARMTTSTPEQQEHPAARRFCMGSVQERQDIGRGAYAVLWTNR